jgi:hypothetical protein
LLHGSENWIIKARDARRIATAEMKYMRKAAGYICTDYKTNTDIVKEINIILHKTYVKYLNFKLYDCFLNICVTWQGTNYKLPENDTIVSKHIVV